MKFSRRNLLKQGSKVGINWLALQLIGSTKPCNLTPQQTEGPFYPLKFPLDDDNDLTWVTNKQQQALGEKIIIIGKIVNINCQPMKDIKVEIWQACHSGRYNHEYDLHQAALDPNFQYWGWTRTDNQGNYRFKTVKPGGYPVTSDWQRPPHIHFKVTADNGLILTTQLYFSEEQALNQKDKILQRIPQAEQPLVTTQLIKQNPSNLRVGKFDIILKHD